MNNLNRQTKSMLQLLMVAVLAIISNQLTAQLASTPRYTGEIPSVEEGVGLNRIGFIHRYDNWVYPDNVLSEWRKKRGDIDPATMTGVLSNPFRQDGTSLNYGAGIPDGFNGHVPVFTVGNYWPHVGSGQTNPNTYNELQTDCGPYYQNARVVSTVEPITREGETGITIVNNTAYSYLVSAGMFPGNEQPGQVMNIVAPNGTAQLPIPPKDWWTINNLNTGAAMSAVPEVYSSVAGLNPLDAPGWKHSSWSPRYEGGVQSRDFGTGGFAYTFGSLFGRNDGQYDLTNTLFAGFHTNEGYDPLVSGDPGYGCAFYVDNELQAVMNISPTDQYTANAIIVARSQHNPSTEQSAFSSAEISHLSCIIGIQPNQEAELHYISHSDALSLINDYSNASGWTRVTKTYESNRQANVTNVALPSIIAGDGDGNDDGSGDDSGDDSADDGDSDGDDDSAGDDSGDDGSDDGDSGSDDNTSYVAGKFAPSEGRLLIIGQDVTSIDDYNEAFDKTPAGHSGYSSTNNVEGITSTASYGSGPHNASSLASNYTQSAISIAIYAANHLGDINNGSLDDEIDLLIDRLVALNRPIFFRFGYEFDGPHNAYDPTGYRNAWIRIYNRMVAKNVRDNFSMVWHSWSSCGNNYNNLPSSDWYPGDDYVDMVGVSIFTSQDCDYSSIDVLVDFARDHNKAVMVCESTPQGYDLNELTKADTFGDNAGITSSVSANQIWDDWFEPYFDYIEENEDIIRVVAYVNADWDSQDFWDAPYGMGYWGDSRVQMNSTIRSNWETEMNKSDWVFASSSLFSDIGYTASDDDSGDDSDDDSGDDDSGDDGSGDDSGDDSSDSDTCGEFGISYINDNTARVYHVDNSLSNPIDIRICMGRGCFEPTLADGYYYFDFNSETSYRFTNPVLGQNYEIQFSANHDNGHFSTGRQTVTFTTGACDFPNSSARMVTNSLENDSFTEERIYPNPVSGSILNIENSAESVDYEIRTMTGKVILKGTGKTVEVGQLPIGVYVLTSATKKHLFIKK